MNSDGSSKIELAKQWCLIGAHYNRHCLLECLIDRLIVSIYASRQLSSADSQVPAYGLPAAHSDSPRCKCGGHVAG